MVEIKDFTPDILDFIKNQKLLALEVIGGQAEKYAKGLCPVDTGRLRNSITHSLASGEDAVYVGSNVEYSA